MTGLAAVPGPTAEALRERVLAALPDLPYRVAPAELDRRPRIGVVFGAGGVLGNAYLAGAVAALHEVTGFEPRSAWALVGTSAGSVHAALYGAGLPALFGLWRNRGGRLPPEIFDDLHAAGQAIEEAPASGWVDVAESETIRDIFTPARALPRLGPSSPALALRALLRPWAYRPEVHLSAWLPEGILTNAAIGQALRRIVPAGWVPHPRTWVPTVSLRTGRRVVFGQPGAPRAHLDRAVRASCAIPGVYRSVRVGRERYIDGGIHSPSNADLLADAGLDLAVVVNPMSSLEGFASTGFVDRYLSPLRHFAGRRLRAELRALDEAEVPTLVLHPTPRDLEVFSSNLMDPRPRRVVAERALETTTATLHSAEAAAAVRLLRLSADVHRGAARRR